jgi:excisionase family DNA binding protein
MDQSDSRSLFLTVGEAAQLLSVSPERLQRALKANQIPSIVVGARRLVARKTIENLAGLVREDA